MYTLIVSLLVSLTAFAQSTTGPVVKTPVTPIEREQNHEEALLQRHKPFYFAFGNPTSKLQLSFKSPLLKNYPLYFGYTQFIFWDLLKDSKPFRDSTYNPELFYRLDAPKDWDIIRSLDIGAFGHNSNGKGGDTSRSYDTQYLRLNLQKDGHRWETRANIMIQYLHNFDPTNKDIQTYVGVLAANLTFAQLFDSWIDKSQISIDLMPGGKFGTLWDYGGYQVSLSFRLGGVYLTPAFYLQYYHGFAETLLNYDERVDEFRGGFIF